MTSFNVNNGNKPKVYGTLGLPKHEREKRERQLKKADKQRLKYGFPPVSQSSQPVTQPTPLTNRNITPSSINSQNQAPEETFIPPSEEYFDGFYAGSLTPPTRNVRPQTPTPVVLAPTAPTPIASATPPPANQTSKTTPATAANTKESASKTQADIKQQNATVLPTPVASATPPSIPNPAKATTAQTTTKPKPWSPANYSTDSDAKTQAAEAKQKTEASGTSKLHQCELLHQDCLNTMLSGKTLEVIEIFNKILAIDSKYYDDQHLSSLYILELFHAKQFADVEKKVRLVCVENTSHELNLIQMAVFLAQGKEEDVKSSAAALAAYMDRNNDYHFVENVNKFLYCLPADDQMLLCPETFQFIEKAYNYIVSPSTISQQPAPNRTAASSQFNPNLDHKHSEKKSTASWTQATNPSTPAKPAVAVKSIPTVAAKPAVATKPTTPTPPAPAATPPQRSLSDTQKATNELVTNYFQGLIAKFQSPKAENVFESAIAATNSQRLKINDPITYLDSLTKMADIYCIMTNYTVAIQLYEQILRDLASYEKESALKMDHSIGDFSLKIKTNLATCYFNLGYDLKALALVNELSKIHPTKKLFSLKTQLLLFTEQYKEVITVISPIFAEDPSHELNILLLVAYRAIRDEVSANYILQKLNAPNNPTALFKNIKDNLFTRAFIAEQKKIRPEKMALIESEFSKIMLPDQPTAQAAFSYEALEKMNEETRPIYNATKVNRSREVKQQRANLLTKIEPALKPQELAHLHLTLTFANVCLALIRNHKLDVKYRWTKVATQSLTKCIEGFQNNPKIPAFKKFQLINARAQLYQHKYMFSESLADHEKSLSMIEATQKDKSYKPDEHYKYVLKLNMLYLAHGQIEKAIGNFKKLQIHAQNPKFIEFVLGSLDPQTDLTTPGSALIQFPPTSLSEEAEIMYFLTALKHYKLLVFNLKKSKKVVKIIQTNKALNQAQIEELRKTTTPRQASLVLNFLENSPKYLHNSPLYLSINVKCLFLSSVNDAYKFAFSLSENFPNKDSYLLFMENTGNELYTEKHYGAAYCLYKTLSNGISLNLPIITDQDKPFYLDILYKEVISYLNMSPAEIDRYVGLQNQEAITFNLIKKLELIKTIDPEFYQVNLLDHLRIYLSLFLKQTIQQALETIEKAEQAIKEAKPTIIPPETTIKQAEQSIKQAEQTINQALEDLDTLSRANPILHLFRLAIELHHQDALGTIAAEEEEENDLTWGRRHFASDIAILNYEINETTQKIQSFKATVKVLKEQEKQAKDKVAVGHQIGNARASLLSEQHKLMLLIDKMPRYVAKIQMFNSYVIPQLNAVKNKKTEIEVQRLNVDERVKFLKKFNVIPYVAFPQVLLKIYNSKPFWELQHKLRPKFFECVEKAHKLIFG